MLGDGRVRTGRRLGPVVLLTAVALVACSGPVADSQPLPSPPDEGTPSLPSTKRPLATTPPAADSQVAVIRAYLDFWDAVEAATDPPDPEHPDLLATAAGLQLEQLQEVIAGYREDGYVRRGDHEHHPSIREFLDGGSAAVVDDCNVLDSEAGLYDAETGERVEGGGEPGDRELLEARLELVDGAWKVVNVNVVEEDSTCVLAS